MWVSGSPGAGPFHPRRPELRGGLARRHETLYQFLLNKWYFDDLHDFILVQPTIRLGRLLWKGGDGWLIDGFGPDGVSARVPDVTRNGVPLQPGYPYPYAFPILLLPSPLLI